MADFMIRFLVSNVFLGGIILFLFLIRRLFWQVLTSRMQYHLWYGMMGLLAVPFLPFSVERFPNIFSWIRSLKEMSFSPAQTFTENAVTSGVSGTLGAIQDFVLASGEKTSPAIGNLFFGVWIAGVLIMSFMILKSKRRFHLIKRSSLPLQSEEVRALYRSCLAEMEITQELPIYSTAFLGSPVIGGLFRPCIYLPIRLVLDCPASKLRHMLLHELQHYRHKDALAGVLMDLAGILYWFHPLVWLALREMRSDREAACDAAVLKLLDPGDYGNYGDTLLELAENISPVSFSSAVGISGSMRQMQRRIIQISTYQKPSALQKAKGALCFIATVAFLLGFVPVLSTCAENQSQYRWDTASKTVSIVDLSSYFQGYSGSFVLYDEGADAWSVYDLGRATLRTSPNSTYKIYDALFALEEGIITSENSFMVWDEKEYPFAAWNADQDLASAMSASVNWYFQKLDEQLGRSAVKRYMERIGYGNQEIRSDDYWMESSLKISPVEQAALLADLYRNRFDFSPENIDALKESICLFSLGNERFYGKTGTARTEGQDSNGWFVGFVETDGNAFFFATNIQSTADATGKKASEITQSILSDMGVWN